MDDLRHVMFVPDSMSREDIATNAAIPLVAAGGLAALTLRAVGEQAGYSPQAVHQWFGARAALHRAVAGRFVARWTRWVELRTWRQGVASLLPENEEVAGWARVWLALHQLARLDDEVASYVTFVRSVEREALGRLAGPDASPEALVELPTRWWRGFDCSCAAWRRRTPTPRPAGCSTAPSPAPRSRPLD